MKKSGKEPKAAAELVLGGTTYKTKAGDFLSIIAIMQFYKKLYAIHCNVFVIFKYILIYLNFLSVLLNVKVCDRSSSPHWNEAFDFLVYDPKKDMLVIKVRIC